MTSKRRGRHREGETGSGAPWSDEDAGTPLHDERLRRVVEVLTGSGVRSVLDLGCGSGALLRCLAADARITRLVGIEASMTRVLLARESLVGCGPPGLAASVHQGSLLVPDDRWRGFDAATMVEVIEHIDPQHLSRVEHAVFGRAHPSLVVITTPNREYNAALGLAPDQLRHPDHRFEWTRSKLRAWAAGVAERNGYEARFEEVGPSAGPYGSPTQMAVFRSTLPVADPR